MTEEPPRNVGDELRGYADGVFETLYAIIVSDVWDIVLPDIRHGISSSVRVAIREDIRDLINVRPEQS